jgi:UDP-N-acetylmuramoyl-tripeptide--D-alanyl-D-alanine ligase
LIGKYNYENLLAAAAVGAYFGVDESEINSALSNYIPENNRSQVIRTDKINLIMDAYNANPSSMIAALENFSNMQASWKVVILGQMNELGESGPSEHQKITNLALSLGFNTLILVGEPYKSFAENENIHYYKDTDSLLQNLKEINLPAGAYVLIKGSRSNRLERLKEAILA